MDRGARWAIVQGGSQESDKIEHSIAAHKMWTKFYQVSMFKAVKNTDSLIDSVIHSFTSSLGQILSNDCVLGPCVKSWNTKKKTLPHPWC